MHLLLTVLLSGSVGLTQAGVVWMGSAPEQRTGGVYFEMLKMKAALGRINETGSMGEAPLLSIPARQVIIRWQQPHESTVSWIFCAAEAVPGLSSDKTIHWGAEQHYLYKSPPCDLSGERAFELSSGTIDGVLSSGLGSFLARCCGCFGSATDEDGSRQDPAETDSASNLLPGDNPAGDGNPPQRPRGDNDQKTDATETTHRLVADLKILIQSRSLYILAQLLGWEGSHSPINRELAAWAAGHGVTLNTEFKLMSQWIQLFSALTEHQGDIDSFALAARCNNGFTRAVRHAVEAVLGEQFITVK